MISESKQIYIKTISSLLKQNNGAVRKIDIARALHYSKPSVTNAVWKLEQDGYVSMEDGNVRLTGAGKAISDELCEKRAILIRLFESLGAGKEDAEENACRMDRLISDDLFHVLKRNVLAEE